MDTKALLHFLTPLRRAALLDAARQSAELVVYAPGGVMLFLDGLHTDPPILERGLALATTLARQLAPGEVGGSVEGGALPSATVRTARG